MLFFDSISFINLSFLLFGFYLLFALFYATILNAADELANPSVIHCFILFSIFQMLSIIWLFGFDFFKFDIFYFFNQKLQLFFLFLASLCYGLSRDLVVFQKVFKFEFDLLFLFTILSGLLLCFCSDFLMVYLIIELQSLSFYVFASFYRISEYSVEAGLKYFIFGAVISCFLLFGFCFIYFFLGEISFESLSLLAFQFDNLLFFGVCLILLCLFFKIGSAPFHI